MVLWFETISLFQEHYLQGANEIPNTIGASASRVFLFIGLEITYCLLLQYRFNIDESRFFMRLSISQNTRIISMVFIYWNVKQFHTKIEIPNVRCFILNSHQLMVFSFHWNKFAH